MFFAETGAGNRVQFTLPPPAERVFVPRTRIWGSGPSGPRYEQWHSGCRHSYETQRRTLAPAGTCVSFRIVFGLTLSLGIVRFPLNTRVWIQVYLIF